MIENEMAKLEKPDHERFRSWLYPSLARCFSSSVSSRAWWGSMGSCASGMGHLLGVRSNDCLEARPARIRL